jgi:1-acyl-sn-glycerol-3-phosphate acyltransferase
MLFFHAIGVICFNLIGHGAHKKSVDYFNWTILRCLNLLGTGFEMEYLEDIPKNVPIIIVSNHQSMWDIPPIIWYLRKLNPKFVSKIELGKGIPAISYNLRHGGSILIDRKNPKQALGEMMKFAKYLVQHNYSGVIFPEGTRSKDGQPKAFHRQGLSTLFKYAPTAYVLPISVNNSWKLQRNGLFPMPLGVRLKHTIHPTLKISDFSSEELIDLVEETVKSKIVV